MEEFDRWLSAELTSAMADLSRRHRPRFLEPSRTACRQFSQSLQDFRNRLAQQTLETLGVALRTTQVELQAPDPPAPDIRVGHIFDRNWELLSPLLPMVIIQSVVKNHFRRLVAHAVDTNLSRLAAQWEDLTGAAVGRLEAGAAQRLDTLLTTVERLMAAALDDAGRIREDLRRLEALTMEGWDP